MRRPHYLRGNKGTRLPVLVIALDTETDSIPIGDDTVEARLRFGWLAVTRRHRGLHWTPPKWYRFSTPTEAWDIIESLIGNERRAWLVCHNAGFDLRVIDAFGLLPERGWELRGAVIEDPPTILRWHRTGQGLICIDTLNYYRTSLASIGQTYGLPKLDMPKLTASTEEWDTYCRRDVEVTLAAFQGIIKMTADLDLGNFAQTFPSIAFTAFRHRHMTERVLIDDNQDALTLARASYYGGRTEAYRLGTLASPVTVYDVVSMYPAVMRDELMPTVLAGHYRKVSLDDTRELCQASIVAADVTVTTEQPVLPWARDGVLLFPVGTWRTALIGRELELAIERGLVERVHAVAVYDRANLFAGYVTEWHARRQEAIATGDLALSDFCKRMMNGLYGKFGQRGDVYERVGPAPRSLTRQWIEWDAETSTIHRYRAFAGLLSERTGATEARDSHPAIAATVTAAARVKLLRLIEAIGWGNVVYVDTDSLFVLPDGTDAADRFTDSTALGALKRERVITDLTIYGVKDYSIGGIRKTKGIRRNAESIAPNVYVQDTFIGLKGAVQLGDIRRQLIRRTTKRLNLAYHKGTILPDSRVQPYRVGVDIS